MTVFIEQQNCIKCNVEQPVTNFKKSRNECEYTDICMTCTETNRKLKNNVKKYNYHKKESNGSWMSGGDGWMY